MQLHRFENVIYNDVENSEYGKWSPCTTNHVLKLMPSNSDLQSLRDWACGSYAMRLSLQYIHHSNAFKYNKTGTHPRDNKITGIV